MAHPNRDVFDRMPLRQHQVGKTFPPGLGAVSDSKVILHGLSEWFFKFSSFDDFQSKLLFRVENRDWLPSIVRWKRHQFRLENSQDPSAGVHSFDHPGTRFLQVFDLLRSKPKPDREEQQVKVQWAQLGLCPREHFGC